MAVVKVAVGVAVAGVLAWEAFKKAQGDSLMTFEPPSLSAVTGDARSVHGEITIVNRGKAGGVVHRVDGRVVDGRDGKVFVTRKDGRVPERGWWRSNCLPPGESCVAEVDVELAEPASGPVEIELDIHEVGRRLKVHRTLRLAVDPLVLGRQDHAQRG
ncbi:MAG: hypothetical protein ACLGI2_01150 [Acidimicrobiia bacterium]